VKIQEQYNCFN